MIVLCQIFFFIQKKILVATLSVCSTILVVQDSSKKLGPLKKLPFLHAGAFLVLGPPGEPDMLLVWVGEAVAVQGR